MTDAWFPPEEAFRLLGEETRMAILRAIWESDEPTVAFSEIRAALGNPDSGRFNYHLGELEGHFVDRGEAGYALTQAGLAVVRAVLAGTITERPEREPARVDAACDECGGPLLASYEGRGTIECGACGATVMWNEFPPAGLEGRSAAEVAAALDAWTRHRFRLAVDGVCPNCAAATAQVDLAVDAETVHDVATTHRCPNCEYEARVPLAGHLARAPAVVAFYAATGVDVASRPYWELRRLLSSADLSVVETAPWTAAVSLRAGEERLRVRVDEHLDVVAVDP